MTPTLAEALRTFTAEVIDDHLRMDGWSRLKPFTLAPEFDRFTGYERGEEEWLLVLPQVVHMRSSITWFQVRWSAYRLHQDVQPVQRARTLIDHPSLTCPYPSGFDARAFIVAGDGVHSVGILDILRHAIRHGDDLRIPREACREEFGWCASDQDEFRLLVDEQRHRERMA